MIMVVATDRSSGTEQELLLPDILLHCTIKVASA
jgi:hypothetical protein